jgi:hypothetical protein
MLARMTRGSNERMPNSGRLELPSEVRNICKPGCLEMAEKV